MFEKAIPTLHNAQPLVVKVRQVSLKRRLSTALTSSAIRCFQWKEPALHLEVNTSTPIQVQFVSLKFVYNSLSGRTSYGLNPLYLG